MSALTANQFLSLVEQSHLLEQDALQDVLEELEAGDGVPDDAGKLARTLKYRMVLG